MKLLLSMTFLIKSRRRSDPLENFLIGILPNEDIDKQSFDKAFLWLSKETFLPNRLRLYTVAQKEYQEFLFTGNSNTILANKAMNKDFFAFQKIKGWKIIENPGGERGRPQCGRPAGPDSPPRKPRGGQRRGRNSGARGEAGRLCRIDRSTSLARPGPLESLDEGPRAGLRIRVRRVGNGRSEPPFARPPGSRPLRAGRRPRLFAPRASAAGRCPPGLDRSTEGVHLR